MTDVEQQDRLGETGPAQSAFRDLDSRKVRTPGGLHAGTPKLRLEKLSSLIVWPRERN